MLKCLNCCLKNNFRKHDACSIQYHVVDSVKNVMFYVYREEDLFVLSRAVNTILMLAGRVIA